MNVTRNNNKELNQRKGRDILVKYVDDVMGNAGVGEVNNNNIVHVYIRNPNYIRNP